MPVELYSYTAQQVATEVQGKFGDIGAVQFNNAALLTWINNGQRKIADAAPFLEDSASAGTIAGQSLYDLSVLFSTARLQSINSITVNGFTVDIVPFSRFQALLPNITATGTAAIGTMWGNVLTLYPIPNKTVANSIVVYFNRYPADCATITAPLTVPDRLYNALVEYVYAQALLLDENFAAAEQLLTHHETELRTQMLHGKSSPTEFYTGVTLDPYDDDAIY